MSFVTSSAFQTAMAASSPSIAVVTGAKSGIGLAIAKKLASLSTIDTVLAVSRSIAQHHHITTDEPKIVPLAADVATEQGRMLIVEQVQRLCTSSSSETTRTRKQLRFLIHAAGTIEPIKSVLEVKPDELRQAMTVNCEAPLLLTTALYPYMQPQSDDSGGAVSGRVLHVSSGAAHGAPPVGWGVYGITKAAFFQTYRVLEREFREDGGKVVVGSFKPGVVDTAMQGTIRSASQEVMPAVENFRSMKAKSHSVVPGTDKASPPPKGALDRPENVAFFAEYLLLGTTDEEFANAKDPNEYDIRNTDLYPLWIPRENLPKEP